MGQQNGDEKKEIVIIGGGIIGCTSAYYLTQHSNYSPKTHRITLLEASTIAGGASGKAGGLLALWAYPSNIVPLSYRLHAELSQKHNGETRWGYRRIDCGQISARGRPPLQKQSSDAMHSKMPNGKDSGSLQKRDDATLGKLRAAGIPDDLDWVNSSCAVSYESMGDPSTTAQVHPYHFTTSMAALAKEAGVDVIEQAHVISIDRTSDTSPSVKSVSWTAKDGTEHTTPANSVVLAAGPWTANLLPSAPIQGLRAHSITIRPSRPVSAYALFTSITLPYDFSSTAKSKKSSRAATQEVSPEIYARPFNEVYACGEGDHLVPLPDSTANVETDPTRCQDILDYVGSISDELRDGEVTARQACYLPVSRGRGGGPWIGEVPDCKGLVIASGHSCWGIQNGPGTGKCVSELLMEGKVRSAKLGQLDPGKSPWW